MAAGEPWPPSPHQQMDRLNADKKKRTMNHSMDGLSTLPRPLRVFCLLLTLIERSPSCHQAWTSSRRLHASGKTHRCDTVGQDHWGRQLHEGYIVVKCLWVELEKLWIRLFQ